MTTPTRHPYHGSCHCGHTRYISYLTLPPPLTTATPPSSRSTLRIRKCNCTTCHKMSFFHLRLMDSPSDFLLLNPLDPSSANSGLTDYVCSGEGKKLHFYFCGICGVRCFAFWGKGVRRNVEIEGVGTEVWTPDPEGWIEGAEEGTGYLSVNAATLDAGQEGLDLKEWMEKGWIAYLDGKNDFRGAPRLGVPYDGGMY